MRVEKYPVKRSAALPLLHLIQEEKGYVPEEAIEWIAKRLELEPINVYEIVTFYPMLKRSPMGRKHVESAAHFLARSEAVIKCVKHFKNNWVVNSTRPPPTANSPSNLSNALPVAELRRWSWLTTNTMRTWTTKRQSLFAVN